MILVALNEMYFTILYIIIASILHHIQKCAHFRHEHQFCCLLDRLHAQAVKNQTLFTYQFLPGIAGDSDDPPVPPTVPVPPGGLLSTCLRLATTSGITASIKLKHSMDLSLPSSPVAISASTYNSPFCTMLINALKK